MPKKKKVVYLCTDCGFDTPKWQGQCPNCGAWNTMVEQVVVDVKQSSFIAKPNGLTRSAPLTLQQIGTNGEERTQTGIGELDRVLGGGMVNGSLILVSGEPGIGKSTLLLQVCGDLCKTDKVLYVTGEESLSQIKMRARRLNIDSEQLFILSETDLGNIIETTNSIQPSTVIIDSIQTIYNPEVQSTPGTVTQVRECTMALMHYAKSNTVTVILVGHVNKDGGIAGPKVLEHMVDAVLNFEGDRHISYRMLRATKNRYGSTNEIGMFEMTDSGLSEVLNPSAALLAGRPENSSGSCVAAVMEGTRPILAEIQGLVTKSAYGASRRTSAGIDYNRTVLLLAILEKRVGFMLGSYDAYINVVGGLSIDEPAVDLAAAMAIASSYLDKPIKAELAVFGEVGLSGEVRAVTGAGQRINELKRLGFQKCIIPKACLEGLKPIAGIEVMGVSDVREAIKKAIGS